MNSNLISESLQKGLSYNSYRNSIKKLLLTKSKSEIEADALLNYAHLNDKRMDRLDKTIKLSEETLASIQKIKNNRTLLVIAESWCGDAAQIVPIIQKIVEQASNKIDLKIVFRDENEALMNLFLTNGNKSIPKVLIIDNATKKVLNSWGPRPSHATKMVLDYKEKKGVIDAQFKKELQIWYNKDKGVNTQNDLLKLLKAS